VFFGLGVLVVGTGCSVYDESLLEPTGAGGSTSSTNTTTDTTDTTTTSVGGGGTGGQGVGGGTTGCENPNECPGADTECGTRTCLNQVCGIDAAPNNTAVASQTAGDCQKNVCDGAGAVTTVNDDTDVKDDGKECTVDGCASGVETHNPKSEGATCGTPPTKSCNTAGNCVDCVEDIDCVSLVCNLTTFVCAPAGCGDNVKNGTETAIDCGGTQCPKCAIGKTCLAASDCLSGSCNGTCQPSCTDGIKNQNESDIDCGGVCPDCSFGQSCNAGTDCDTGACSTSSTCTCAPNPGVFLISEVRARGLGGANDEFVELFNPGTSSLVLSSTWTISSRSDSAGSYTVRYTGAGQTVPAGGHILIGGSAYAGSVAADATLASGITDAASVVVKDGTTVVDAVCFHCGADPFTTHTCEGMPAVKVGCASNTDKSVERKPGGLTGNCIDTQNNSADFAEVSPSNPQNLASTPTP